jgi:hypothetical protein
MLVLSSGCLTKKTEVSPRESEMSAVFDIAQAMKMFYGNYDVTKQTSVASLPREISNDSAAYEQQMTIRVLFGAFSGDAGTKSFVLVTYAVPATEGTFDCHGCGPAIGMAVFSRRGLDWTIDASNKAVTNAGGWGKPPTDIQLVPIGPKRIGVMVKDFDSGGGETSETLLILTPWNRSVNLSLRRVIADDDKDECDSGEDLPCYANRRTFTFVPTDKGEYYNLELKLSGTDYAAMSLRSRRVHGLEILKFENGKYVRVSRQGDLTNLDRFVAGNDDP